MSTSEFHQQVNMVFCPPNFIRRTTARTDAATEVIVQPGAPGEVDASYPVLGAE